MAMFDGDEAVGWPFCVERRRERDRLRRDVLAAARLERVDHLLHRRRVGWRAACAVAARRLDAGGDLRRGPGTAATAPVPVTVTRVRAASWGRRPRRPPGAGRRRARRRRAEGRRRVAMRFMRVVLRSVITARLRRRASRSVTAGSSRECRSRVGYSVAPKRLRAAAIASRTPPGPGAGGRRRSPRRCPGRNVPSRTGPRPAHAPRGTERRRARDPRPRRSRAASGSATASASRSRFDVEAADEHGHRLQREPHVAARREDRWLVLLKVAVVRRAAGPSPSRAAR